jgi:predicted SnoaL-like aldol condensation-catalyzing enzyme
MNQSKEEENKALVLEAFGALFNRRDYAAAERYWSPNYIQHRPILLLDEKASSAWSRVSHQP